MKLSKKILSLVLAVMLAFGCISVALATGETGASPEDAIPFTVSNGVKGNLSNTTDKRWYKVDFGTTMAMATFSLKIPGSSTSAIHYKVDVFSADNLTTPVSSFDVKGDVQTTSSDPVLVTGGEYYVRIGVGTTFVNVEYTLSVKVVSDLKTETEDNNDKANADAVTAPSKGYSETFYGSLADKTDKDWFKFTAPKGFFQVDFVALSSGVDFTVTAVSIFSEKPSSEFYTEQTIGEMTVNKDDCETSSSNTEGFVTTADIGVDAGTYFIKVGTSSDSFANANYKVRVYVEPDNNTEKEYNGSTTFADELKLPGKLFGSISFDNDFDYYRVTTKDDAKDYKIKVSGGKVQNDDSASWYVSMTKNGNVVDGFPKVADMNKPVEIDMNGYEAGTYYILISKNSDTKGNYIIEAEKFSSDAKPQADGNFFQRVWARIKALPWNEFWNNNFRELVLNLGSQDGQIDINGDGKPDLNKGMFTVLKDLFTMSFGTIFKILKTN